MVIIRSACKRTPLQEQTTEFAGEILSREGDTDPTWAERRFNASKHLPDQSDEVTDLAHAETVYHFCHLIFSFDPLVCFVEWCDVQKIRFMAFLREALHTMWDVHINCQVVYSLCFVSCSPESSLLTHLLALTQCIGACMSVLPA